MDSDEIDEFKNEMFDVNMSDDDDDLKNFDGEEIADLENVKPAIKNKNEGNADCCHKVCLSNFDVSFRSHLKSSLSKLNKSEKQIYLFGMISINEDKQFRPGSVKTSSKLFKYGVRKNGEMFYVCKTAFMDLHATTVNAVRTLCSKMMNKNILIPSDNRGKHQKHYFIPESTQELIEAHFYSILESTSVSLCHLSRVGITVTQPRGGLQVFSLCYT